MLLKVKQQVIELKEIVAVKDQELNNLKKNMKSTKMREMDIQLKMYMSECIRLREMTENAIKASGEIEVNQI